MTWGSRQGLPEEGLPEEGLPEEGLPEEGLPEEGLPEAGRDGALPGAPRRVPVRLAALIALVALVAVAASFRPAPAAADPAGGAIETLRLGVHPGKTRLVLETTGRPDYRAFTLDDPYRVVIDFPRLNWRDGPERGGGKGLVERFRIGAFDSRTTRLVLDARRPVAIDRIFWLDARRGAGARFVLDLAPISEARFAKRLSKSFGALPDRRRRAHAAAGGTPGPGGAPIATARPERERKLIMLDPGHGGVDPGAIAVNGTYEKAITLAVGRLVARRLEATGRYEVEMTRDSDVYVSLGGRVRKARAARADLFVSLHADSIRSRKVKGVSVYTLSETASDKEAAELARRENRSDVIAGVDLAATRDDVANILIDLAMRETMNQAKRLANMLVEEVARDGITTLRNTHRYAGFAVLKAPDIPSVLVEMGYLSNPDEARLLENKAYQRRVADSVIDGIDRYFNWLEAANRI